MRTVPLAVVGLLTAASLSVTLPAEAQTVSGIAPASVGNDGTKVLTLTGSGFYPADQEQVLLRANPAIPDQADLVGTVTNKTACTGFTIPGLSNADCGTELSVSVNTTNARPGTYDVVETQTDQSQIPSVDSSKTLSPGVAIYSQPTIATVSPASRGQGGTSTITVTGTGFAAGVTAGFGAGTTVGNVVVQSPTSLTADVTVAGDAALGTRDVTLTAGSESATKVGAFTVAQGPLVDSVTPNKLLRGTSGSITVSGSHFLSGDGFALTINGATLTDVVVNPAGTQITADVDIPVETPYGLRAVRVRNPDAGTFALDYGFAVTAPPGAPSGVTVTTGDGTAFVSWTAPSDPGSSPVTGYTVSTSDVSVPVKEVTGTTAAFAGLANGTAYTFTVTPKNDDAGAGSAATATGTPRYATTLTLTGRSSAAAGQSVVYSGTLKRSTDASAVAGVPVLLRIVPSIGSAVTRIVQTTSDGRFSTTFRTTYNLRVTATYAGRTEDAPATPRSVTTLVATRISVISPKSGAVSAASQTITVVGSLSPNKHGRVVGCYYGNRLVGKAVVATNGSFRIPVKLARGNYRLQVRIGATPGNIAGQSPAFIVSRR